MDWAAMTPKPEKPRKQRCRTSIMVNADKLSTEHTWNTLSIERLAPVWGGGKTDQTAYKPGSVPTRPRRTQDGRDGHSSGPDLADRFSRPTRTPRADDGPAERRLGRSGAGSLFGLAPGGACHAVDVPTDAVRSYRPLSPLPVTGTGGLLSVALSLGSPPAGVPRRHVVVEPGLSSTAFAAAAARPSDPGRQMLLPASGVKASV